jgi:hypothetical protein
MDAERETIHRSAATLLFPRTLLLSAVVALGTAACNGAISGIPDQTPTGVAGQGGSGGQGGSAGLGGSGGTAPPDVGRIAVHRLNSLEYDNTMRDLLGVDGTAQKTFQPDEAGEFDNDAEQFQINDARFEQYFSTADAIGEQVFADTTPTGLRQTYVYGLVSPSCVPSATDTACTAKIISAFAQKAWRRPVSADELKDLVKLATDAVGLGETADGGIKQVVKTLLASPPFLYRIEMDPNPNSLQAHPLDPYELATRLSYLVWSSMPDKTLFDLAASKQISSDAVLSQQVDRMLADPKAASFTQSFAGQWLGARNMLAHQVEKTAFPTFDEPLRTALVQEELMYFDQFLQGTLPMTEFFTTPNNFVNTRLAKHYGMPAVTGTAFQKVSNADPNRVGFLGLGSFLTFTSYSYRTAPTLRGRWVLLNLLCQRIDPPATLVPKLDDPTKPATDPSLQQENVRERLEMHRMALDCAACHNTLDPIGIGLENFDAIGAYRTKYSPTATKTIDSSGMLPTGETFTSVATLAALLSTKDRVKQLTDCSTRKMMTYALSRALTSSDTPYLNQIRTSWSGQGWGLKALMKDVVLNDTFRYRRGEQ